MGQRPQAQIAAQQKARLPHQESPGSQSLSLSETNLGIDPERPSNRSLALGRSWNSRVAQGLVAIG